MLGGLFIIITLRRRKRYRTNHADAVAAATATTVAAAAVAIAMGIKYIDDFRCYREVKNTPFCHTLNHSAHHSLRKTLALAHTHIYTRASVKEKIV